VKKAAHTNSNALRQTTLLLVEDDPVEALRIRYELEAFEGQDFPLIISLQVFEHLHDPRRTLRSLKEHLVPPSMIYIEVPNLNATEERIRRGSTMDDSHFTYFSDRGLSRMLRDEGFEIVEIHQGVRPYRFLSVETTLPLGLIRAGERGAALLGLRSVLGILARLRPEAAPAPKST